MRGRDRKAARRTRLEGDAAAELHMRHVPGRLAVAAVGARRPGASDAELRQRRPLDAGPEPVVDGDAGDTVLPVVQVVRHVAEHASRVAMVVVVEGVASVALAGRHVCEVAQPSGPQKPAGEAPRTLSQASRSRTAAHRCLLRASSHSTDSSSAVRDLARSTLARILSGAQGDVDAAT